MTMMVIFHPTGRAVFSECDEFHLGEPLQIFGASQKVF